MKKLNQIKIHWLIPLLMALAFLLPFNSFALDVTPNFSWLKLIPPGSWLDSWSFEEMNWDSDFGFAPLSYSNIVQVPDWGGNALQVDTTNAAWLAYNITENAPGYGEYTNLTLNTGSIEFWFLANWESADTNYFGAGPGDWGRFIDIGTWATNADWWSLYLNPSGTDIYFSSGTNGVRTNYLNTSISWNSNLWHMVVLTFSPSNSFIYLDGQLVASGDGVRYLPSGNTLTNGFSIGSDFATGTQQAHGQFDDLYTYNYQLSANDVANDYAEISPELPGSFYPGGGFGPDDEPPGPGGGGGGGGGSGGSYTPPVYDYGTNLWIAQETVSSNYFTGIASNTIPGVSYQLLYANSLNPPVQWIPDGLIIGTDETNWTPWMLPFNPATNCFLNLLSWQTDGSGIPIWWQLKYFGTNIDPGADPIGDGYTLYQDFANGWIPTNWNTPPAPQGLAINGFYSSSDTATLSWLPSPGGVTNYTLQTPNGNVNLGNVTSYIDDESSFGATYSVQADYAGGPSAWSDSVSVDGDPPPNATIVPDPQGNLYLVGSGLPSDLSEVRIYRNSWSSDSDTWLPEADNYVIYDAFATDPLADGFFEIPAANITNGVCQIPSSDVTPLFAYQFEIQTVRSNGVSSGFTQCGVSNNYSLPAVASVPFIDARRQLKDNLQFLLRAGDDTQPIVFQGWDSQTTNQVCADFYGSVYVGSPAADPLEPLEDNIFFKNFIFDPDNMVNVDGFPWLGTGIQYNGYGNGSLTYINELPNPGIEYYFDINNFVSETNFVVPASVLSSNSATYITPASQAGIGEFEFTFPYIGDTNVYGLPYVQAEFASYSNNILNTQIIYPEQNENLLGAGWPYLDAQSPTLQITNYYFCAPTYDEMPEATDFAATNSTPLIIVPVGGGGDNTPTQLAGYARAAVLNGNPGVYGYIGQYFANAYEIGTNGDTTTNTTGFLSPYGQFFATEPGPVAVVTMPDIDTGQQGTGVVYCVSMNVDKNHDGVMDTSYSGADATSQASPMEFWVNDGCDVPGVNGGLDKDKEVPPATNNATLGRITCPRDLENFARLWVCGMPPLPTDGSFQIKLSWANVAGNPAINLYTSVETNGGIGYLTDTNIAAEQCQVDLGGSFPDVTLFGPSFAIATNLSSDSAYTFPEDYFTNGANQYFLFEGAGIGEGELKMTVYQNSNVIAQTGVWLDLRDIQDFYEQAYITNNTSGTISNWTSGIEYVTPSIYNALGNDTNNIVFVHGFNVGYWDWLNDSATIYKRLYWAGFDGQFMTVKWPCEPIAFGTLASENTTIFNNSEIKAYKAGSALASYLTQLRSRYPGYQLNVLAHSQGNAIMGEAIEDGAPFDNYIITQGAMPDSCYDVNATNYTPLVAAEDAYPTPLSQPMGYEGVYTNITGNIINFYNPYDPVLNIWLLDQAAGKPNGYVNHEITPLASYYSYDGTYGWYNYDSFLTDTYLVTDPQESRAMISRSLTLPIGQSGPTAAHGVIRSAVNLNTSFGFYNALPADHSAEWTWPIQTTLLYYYNVLSSFNIPTSQLQ